MKVTCKKTGKDMTSKVIKALEKSLVNSGYTIISKSPYRDKDGNFLDCKFTVQNKNE